MTAVTLWCTELRLLIQNTVNPLSLLIPSRRKASIIRWSFCAIILFINIAAYCIWISARLQVSQTNIDIDNIFDQCEKVIYLILDGALNFYFCYLIKTKLISAGMMKYYPLYRSNLITVFVSLSMDVLLIGVMSMPNQFIYVQYHPVCYMVRLNIEISMAHMISKSVTATGEEISYSGKENISGGAKMSSSMNGSGSSSAGASKHQILAGDVVVRTSPRSSSKEERT